MSEKPDTPKSFEHRQNLDLHESEWHHDAKKVPILGRNGVFFCIMVPISIVIVSAVRIFFAWTKEAFGDPNGLYVGLVIGGLFVWLGLIPLLNVCYGLADWTLRKLFRR